MRAIEPVTVAAVVLRSIEAGPDPVAIIPATNGPERYEASVTFVVMANGPL